MRTELEEFFASYKLFLKDIHGSTPIEINYLANCYKALFLKQLYSQVQP